MNRWRILSAVLIATVSSTAMAEADYPTPGQFVAVMEFSIEVCSRRSPALATKYAALRDVVNSLFAKRNYAEYLDTPDYRQAYAVMKAEVASYSEADMASHCSSMLRMHETPPQGVVYLK